MSETPTLFIIAGANGSGKTTLAWEYLPYMKVEEFVNADEIARGLSPFNPSDQRMAAGRLVIKRRRELIEECQRFAVETTLSGSDLVRDVQRAKKAGYLIWMCYVHTNDVAVNIERIKNRVKEGGHDVPESDVIRQRKRSLLNLFHVYFDLCDTIAVFDNSSGKQLFVASRITDDTVDRERLTVVTKDCLLFWKKMKKEADVK